VPRVNKKKNLANILLALSGILAGLYTTELFLTIDARPKGTYSFSYREATKGSTLFVSHSKDYSILSHGENSIVLLGDSFGAGEACGNHKNLAGCLSSSTNKHIVNLSKSGTNPAYHVGALEMYLRNFSQYVRGETVIMLLYFNDIELDEYYCNFVNSDALPKRLSKALFKQYNARARCDSISRINSQRANSNYTLRSAFILLRLKHVFQVIENSVGSLKLSLGLESTTGRSAWSKNWQSDSLERSLLVATLQKLISLCEIHKCKPQMVIYPSVEDLSATSPQNKSYIKFARFMSLAHGINIHNGIKPFLDIGVKSSRLSLTDAHPDCNAHKILSEWLQKNFTSK